MTDRSTCTLITGASSGIGEELARLFAADGHALILVARRRERLEALAAELKQTHGVEVQVLPADLADPEAPEQIFRQISEAGWVVDELVNNAGFGLRGAFLELDLQEQLNMIQVNVTALTHLTGRFLPGMRARGRGGVLNVASTAAFQPGPCMAVYYATKAYVLHFSEALHEEMKGTGIRVTCLAPGPTATEFPQRARMDQVLLFKLRPMSAEAVARAGYRGFREGRRLVIPGLMNRMSSVAGRLFPRTLVMNIVKRLQS